MILSLEAQGQLFFLAVLLGGSIGLGYDGLRIFRYSLPHTNFLVHLEDAIFWIGSLFFVFQVVLKENRGEIRFFFLLGIFCGMALYFSILSHLLMAISHSLITAVKKCIHLIFEIIFTPFSLVWHIFRKPVLKCHMFCEKKRVKLLQSLQFYVKIKSSTISREWRMVGAKKKQRKEYMCETQRIKKKDISKKNR